MQRQLGMTAGLSPSELTDYSLRRVPEPLVPRALVFGIRERVDYRGEPLGPLQEDDVRAAAAQIRAAGVEAVAISFLWSFKNPAHERRAAEILTEELPDVYVAVSSELAPRLGEYERTATTLVNAYLGPVISRYTAALERRLGTRNLLLLDSSGSVMSAGQAGRFPARLLLSGPSGGVTASRFLGEALGHPNVITFDMGGTSTDVGMIRRAGSRCTGWRPRSASTTCSCRWSTSPRSAPAGARSPGSRSGGYLRVGPRSAGAVPGPACYGAGGDAADGDRRRSRAGDPRPGSFLGGRIKLDVAAARDGDRDHVAEPLGLSVARGGGGDQADRRRADGRPDADGDARARPRSAGVRALRVRRRRRRPRAGVRARAGRRGCGAGDAIGSLRPRRRLLGRGAAGRAERADAAGARAARRRCSEPT